MAKKYLLCRPRGGLNDALSQIEWCWQYAELFNRVLIIDTEYLVATGISVRFSKLFKTLVCNENVILNVSTSLLNNLNQLNTFPPSCKGRLDSYKTKMNENLIHTDRYANTMIGIEFKNYEEDLLINDQFGNVGGQINALARLKLTDEFRGDVLSKLSPLIGKNHMAIHVRHTEYQSDYKRFFEEIYDRCINQRLLICTDGFDVINYAKSFFDKTEIVTLGLPPDSGGIGLVAYATFQCNDQQRYNLMVEAFADLIGLATAKEIIFCRLTLGKFADNPTQNSDLTHVFKKIDPNQIVPIPINGFSGFSVLAEQLRDNPLIIDQLLTS